MKVRGYYKKIAANNNFEKLVSVDRDLMDMIELYGSINKIHSMIDKRGIDCQNVIAKYCEIRIVLTIQE